MSALGHTLIRPQRFDRSYPVGGLRMADILAELAVRLTMDVANGGHASQKISSALEIELNQLQQEIANRQRTAARKVNDWFKPLLDSVKEGIQLGASANSAESTTAALSGMIKMLSDALQHMSADELAERLNALGDIVENDLGLSGQRLVQLGKDIVDGVIEALTRDYIMGEDSREAKNAYLIGNYLASLKLFVLNELERLALPAFDRRALVNDLANELKNRRWDAIVAKLGEITGNVSTAAGGLSALFNLNGSVSVGANRGTDRIPKTAKTKAANRAASRQARDAANPVQVSWYASWCFANRFLSNYVTVQDRLHLSTQTLSEEITFGDTLNDGFMEQWAHLSAGFGDLVEAALHGVSIEKGDYINNLVNGLLQLGKGIFTFSMHGHEGEDSVKAIKVLENFFFENGLALVGTFFSSFERYPGSAGAWAHSGLMTDALETLLYKLWTENSRDFTLSLFTLSNSNLTAHPNSKNYQKDQGFIFAFVEAGLWLSALFPRAFGRKHYGWPFSDNGGAIAAQLLFYILGGIGGAFLTAFAGWGVARAISGKYSDTWKDGGFYVKLLLQSAVQYPIYYYLLWEGDTDGGRFGLAPDGRTIVAMPGYADAASSPYKLPYEKGKTLMCVQGHHGYYSHHAKTTQIYGVDFTHEFGDKVLAMRGGTVVAYEDSKANTNGQEWNYVVIRHDDTSEGTVPNPQHDKDETGVKQTFAIYGHGRYLGVSDAFASKGIPASAIIGVTVRQGDLIMYAGSTGYSAYNHLHVHITTAAPNTSSKPAYTVPHHTIPFVFREVTNFLGKDGVPKSLNHYTSDNEETPDPGGVRYQPYRWQGGIVSAGNDYAELDATASPIVDHYKNCHLLIRHEAGSGRVSFYYKKIKSYDGLLRRAFIEANWESEQNPPNGSTAFIGAKPYDEAVADDKKFAFLASGDPGSPANFPDGKTPYQWQ